MSISSRSTKFLLLATLVPIILGDLGRIRISGSLFINLTDITAIGILLFGLSQIKSLKDKTLKTYLIWLTGITATFALSLILRLPSVPVAEIIKAVFYPARFLALFLLPLILIPLLTKTQTRVWYSRAFLLSFAVLTLAGLLQIIIFPNLQILEYIGYDPHYFRVVSTWLDPNFLGAGLTFAILFTLAQKNTLSKYEKIILLALFTLTPILTFSRSAYIMATLAVLAYALLQRSWKTFFVFAAIAALTASIYLVPRTQIDASRNIDRSFSANMRLKSYGDAITLFQQSPLTGIGYNLIRYEKERQMLILDNVQGGNSGAGIDSSWLAILATTGILGFITFLAFWIRQAFFIIDLNTKNSSKHFSSLKQFITKGTSLQHATLALLAAWSIHAWFINSLFYSYLMLIWVIMFSITYADSLDNNKSKL